jgi:hypothetical protein
LVGCCWLLVRSRVKGVGRLGGGRIGPIGPMSPIGKLCTSPVMLWKTQDDVILRA